ncbi:MAG: hypothetical protein ABJK37_03550 [Paraglaciecola sp.]|uniref:hypothetical protein n=1 Tax=Paraglaciecola sp. TaxID=1920173 RepID=UPI00329A71C5
MNKIKTFRALLASSIAIALVGCDDSSGDFKPEVQANTVAPTHGGDIVLAFNEKDEITFIDLLGTPSGASSGEGVARDADGNFLRVTDVVIEGSGSRSEDIMDAGAELNGNQLGVRSLAIAPYLDDGEMHTIVVSYNISDGVNKTPRTATLTFTGEDFAPVSNGPVVGNFTRDAGVGSVNLLATVFDADNELLTVTNFVADSGNLYDLPITPNGNGAEVEVDISAVESSIPDGQKVEFKFSYTVSDHRFDIEQTMIINVLGVQDIPGAPLVLNYFKTAELNETDTLYTVDLQNEIDEREGDPIVISDVMLNGEALPYGYSIDGSMLSIDPHAFFNDVQAGKSIQQKVTYRVSDDQGNMSDGVPELTVVINGQQTNLIAATGFSVGFEDQSQVGPLDQTTNPGGFEWGWAGWGCPSKEIRSASAHTGDYGMLMEGSFCHFEIKNILTSLEDNQKYAMSYWLRNEASNGVNGNPYVTLYTDVGDTDLNNRFWWGTRYFDQSLNNWMEHVQMINTNESGNWNGYETLPVHLGLLKYDDSYSGGRHDIDDLNMVKFGHFDTDVHDMLVDDAGTFEGGEAINADAGIAEVREVDGMNKLYVDTTGATDGVTISLPVKMGAIRTGGRYAVAINAQLLNHDTLYAVDANTQVTFNIGLSNGIEIIAANGNGSTWGPDDSPNDIIITEEFGRSSNVDWSSETMMLNITLPEANAQYHIDDVRLIAIP